MLRLGEIVVTTEPNKRPILVLGAGPAGLSAAWKLSQDGRKVIVLERGAQVGGLGATSSINGMRLDYGPHIFCMRETKESIELIEQLKPCLGEDPRIFKRRDRIFLLGRYYTYPVRISELLMGLPAGLTFRILFDYARANATLKFHSPKKDSSFEEWGVKNLGRTLYDLCFGIYSRKVWGLPTSQISSRQAQRVAKLNLTEIILRVFGFKVDPVTHFRNFLYPRGGIGLLYERMTEDIEKSGGEIRLGRTVHRIIRQGNRIESVVCATSTGGEERVECSGVISTLPLPVVAGAVEPPLPPEIREHARQLKYRSLQFCYVVVNKERATDLHWCYLLDPPYRCNRVSEQKNVSEEMLPRDKTVLLFEISCDYGDAVWNAGTQELRRIVDEDIRRSKILEDPSLIVDFFTRRVDYVYPVYQLHFEDHLFPVLRALHGMDNFISVGRHGLFLNNSMDDNILLGFNVRDFLQGSQDGAWHSERWFAQMRDYMHLRFEGK